MKKMDIIDYLEQNCICDPNANMDSPYWSMCLLPCKAVYHWRWEVYRTKLEMSLGMRFDPPTL